MIDTPHGVDFSFLLSLKKFLLFASLLHEISAPVLVSFCSECTDVRYSQEAYTLMLVTSC